MNSDATSQFPHHWEYVAVVVHNWNDAGTKDKDCCKKIYCQTCVVCRAKIVFVIPNVTEYAAIWVQVGTQMYAYGSNVAPCSVHSVGQQSIAAEIHVKHIQHWHPWRNKKNQCHRKLDIIKKKEDEEEVYSSRVRVCTVSYLNGFRTAKYLSTDIHINV